MNHRIREEWIKWKNISWVCDHRIVVKLHEPFYKIAIIGYWSYNFFIS